MGERPDGATLDRINNDGGYCPENCRWADRKTQNRNTGRNRTLEINGSVRCISEWAELAGVPPVLVIHRLKLGWPAKEAVFAPIKKPTDKRTKRRDWGAQDGVSKRYFRQDRERSFSVPIPPGSKPVFYGPYPQMERLERVFVIDGTCKPLGDWMDSAVVPLRVVKSRLGVGWDPKAALFTPSLGIGQKRPGIRKKAPQT